MGKISNLGWYIKICVDSSIKLKNPKNLKEGESKMSKQISN